MKHRLEETVRQVEFHLSETLVPLHSLERVHRKLGEALKHPHGMLKMLQSLPPHHVIAQGRLHQVGASRLTRMLEGAHRACEVQMGVTQLHADIKTRLLEPYGEMYPNLLDQQLFEAHMTVEALRKVARIRTVYLLQTRLNSIETRLSGFSGDARRIDPETDIRDGQLTLDELHLLRVARVAELEDLALMRAVRERSGPARAKQINKLGAAERYTPASRPAHLVAEPLARSFGIEHPVSSPLWFCLVASASATRGTDPGENAWSPSVNPPNVAGPKDASLYWVLSISAKHIYISKHQSMVRFWGKSRPELGEVYEGRLFAGDSERNRGDDSTRELRMLYEGADDIRENSIVVEKPLKFKIIGKDSCGWFGVVTKKGRIKIKPRFAVSRSQQIVNLPPFLGSIPPHVLVDIGLGFWETSFLGIRAFSCVSQPLWAKDYQPGWEDISDVEQELFQELGREGASHALRFMGWGKEKETMGAYPLYEAPFGSVAHENDSTSEWLAGHRRELLGAVARLLVKCRELEWAVGILHGDMFVYAPTVSTRGKLLTPHITLCHAPAAARYGMPLPVLPLAKGDRPIFKRLNRRWLPKSLIDGEEATPDTDARSFVIYALDLLLRRPVEVSRGSELVRVLEALAVDDRSFEERALALEMLEVIHVPARLWKIVERVAEDG